MRFLPPGPNSTGSIAAQPAPAGGRFGLFRAVSTQGNCLPLGWANWVRVQNNRKCSKGGRCQDSHLGERGHAEPKVFIQFGGGGAAGLEPQPGNQPGAAMPLPPRWSNLIAGAGEPRRGSLQCCQIDFPKAQL